MTALLAWVDHDAAARQRMHQVLALFRERDTRDELGIGGDQGFDLGPAVPRDQHYPDPAAVHAVCPVGVSDA